MSRDTEEPRMVDRRYPRERLDHGDAAPPITPDEPIHRKPRQRRDHVDLAPPGDPADTLPDEHPERGLPRVRKNRAQDQDAGRHRTQPAGVTAAAAGSSP